MRKIQIVLPLLLLSIFCFGQQKLISGKVLGKTSNEPLQGVSVQNKKQAVATDANGAFSIPAVPGDVLTFSFVGMATQRVKVTSATATMVLALEDAVNDLNQVVVTGYKSEKKADLTGAVS